MKEVRRMPSSGMLRRVALVRTDVSEKLQFLQEPHCVTFQKTSFFRVTAVETSNITKKSGYPIGIGSHGLPACAVAPQPLMIPFSSSSIDE
jgi:hypothetical protein